MSTATDDELRAPVALPPGRTVDLADGGRGFVRADLDGPADDRPHVLLLHGWTVTADTTFAPTYPTLAEQYRVIAPDLRGHGRSSPAPRRTRLEHLADDGAAVLDALGVERAIVVGNWSAAPWPRPCGSATRRRSPGSSSARRPATSRPGRWATSGTAARPGSPRPSGPSPGRPGPGMVRAVDGKVADGPYAAWYRQELLRSDPPSLLRVGAALGRFRPTAGSATSTSPPPP